MAICADNVCWGEGQREQTLSFGRVVLPKVYEYLTYTYVWYQKVSLLTTIPSLMLGQLKNLWCGNLIVQNPIDENFRIFCINDFWAILPIYYVRIFSMFIQKDNQDPETRKFTKIRINATFYGKINT